jgi:hypothetical protein
MGIFNLLFAIVRIIAVIVCTRRAKELNRNTGGWGIFGFFFPIIATIWIYCLGPIDLWSRN